MQKGQPVFSGQWLMYMLAFKDQNLMVEFSAFRSIFYHEATENAPPPKGQTAVKFVAPVKAKPALQS